jgi:acetylornithine deacetylase/succinyl-diaminopimelate desuccinylase-like protein
VDGPGDRQSDADLAEQLREEVVGLLAELLRADTSNPPGDARPAAAVLQRYFRDHGVEPALLGEDGTLPNVVARLDGDDSGPSLLLLGHLDVVPADPGAWAVPPFSGAVQDGYVWGRGALDMKNQVASQAVAFVRLARLAREGHGLHGDLVYAATADEETGMRCGAAWLLREHPELVRADYAVNEGGLDMFRLGDGRLYTIHTGEKGYANCRITVKGRAGHGSVPLRHPNALRGLAQIVEALHAYEPEVRTEHLPVDFVERAVADPGLRARLLDPATAQSAVRELAAAEATAAVPGAAGIIEPMLGLTFSPTVAEAGDAVNVIPGSAELVVDCRLLPGQTEDDVRRELRQALAGVDAEWELELFGCMPGNASPARSPLRDAIVATLAELVPDADVVDALFSGFTDSVHVRNAFPGTVAYGFCPFVVETGDKVRPRLHGVDERITVEDVVFQTVFTERLVRRLLG